MRGGGGFDMLIKIRVRNYGEETETDIILTMKTPLFCKPSIHHPISSIIPYW